MSKTMAGPAGVPLDVPQTGSVTASAPVRATTAIADIRPAGTARSRMAVAGAASLDRPAVGVAYRTLCVLVLCLASNQLDVAIVPYLAPYIKSDLRLTDMQLGWLLGASFGLFYTLIGVPIAWFIDRYSRRWILALGLIAWNIGTALCGAAQNYSQLFVARFVVGAGEGVNGPTSYSIVADLFPRERLPRGIALLQVGTVVGKSLAMLIGAWLLYRFVHITPLHWPFGLIRGWQLIFILIGLPSTLIAVLLLTSVPEPARHTIAEQLPGSLRPDDPGEGLARFVRDFGIALRYMALHWRVFAPMFGSVLASSLALGALEWQPIFFQRTFGWQPARLALLQPLVQLLMLAGMGLGVLLAERFARRQSSDAAMRVFIVARLVALPALFGALMPTPWLAFACSALAYFGIGLGSPSQNAALQIVTPAELRGKITALYLFIYSVIGVGLAPVLYGFIDDFLLRDESMIRWAIFWPSAIFNPLCVLIAWLGLSAYGREVSRLRRLDR